MNKILFPIGSFYPAQSGGPSNTIYWLAKALRSKGIKTVIVTTNKDIQDPNIKFDQFIEHVAGKVIYCEELNYNFSKKIIKISIQELKNTDIVHLTSLFYIPSLIIAFFARIYNKNVVWSVRGELESSALGFRKYLKKIYLKFIKAIINDNFTFHSTSQSESKNITKFFINSNIIELPNYIELPKKYDFPIKKQIIYLGRLHPIKNLEVLIYALYDSEIFKKENYKMIIAGVGTEEYTQKLKNLVKELKLTAQIKFVGMVTGEEKEKLLAESKALVLPSLSENFGNVVVESLAQGTPVVASHGTPWKILEDNKAGYWVKGSQEELSFAIDKILTLSENEYIKMRNNAYKLVCEEFDILYNVDKWINAYEKVLSER